MMVEIDMKQEQKRTELGYKTHIYPKIKEKGVNKDYNFKDIFLSYIFGVLLTLQIVLVFFFYNYEGFEYLTWIGWSLLVPFCIFGRLPILEFKKHGEVEDGKSYVYTTKLVTSGVYSIVRHPQFLSFILLSLAIVLMSQHWIETILGIAITILLYLEAWRSDKGLVRKFGDDYKTYMIKVPRMNFIWGGIKACWHKLK